MTDPDVSEKVSLMKRTIDHIQHYHITQGYSFNLFDILSHYERQFYVCSNIRVPSGN
jgi:hypothetical protein